MISIASGFFQKNLISVYGKTNTQEKMFNSELLPSQSLGLS